MKNIKNNTMIKIITILLLANIIIINLDIKLYNYSVLLIYYVWVVNFILIIVGSFNIKLNKN